MIGAGQLLSSASGVSGSAQFDGTNDYLTRGADMSGNSDGKQGTLSFWIRIDGGDGTTMRIFRNATTLAGATSRFSISRVTTNAFNLTGSNSADTIILQLVTSTVYTASATWFHYLSSWDMATAGARYIYVNDVADLGVTTFTNDTIDYTGADWSVGAVADGTNKLNGCLFDLWFNPAFIDISVTNNRRLFISAAGKPVNLGPNGKTPTGSAPLVFDHFSGNAASFATNLGTGGGWTTTGTLTTGSTNPL